MNKRWSNRIPVSLGLVVNYPALGLLRGKAVNVSHDGMFIETAAISLCNYSEIQITLNLPKLSDSPIQLQATIIHNHENGIGVMFKNDQNYDGIASDENIGVIHQLVAKPESFYQQAS